jgi:hypothetical protein
LRDVKNYRRVSDIDADLGLFRLRKPEAFQHGLGQGAPSGSVDDKVGMQGRSPAFGVLEMDAGNGDSIRRGDNLGDAAPGKQSDVMLLVDTFPGHEFEQGPRHEEVIEPEISYRERVKTGSLPREVDTHPHFHGARSFKVACEIRAQFLERVLPAEQERVRMPRLRRALTWLWRGGQSVAIEHRDLIEMGRQRLRRRQAAHPGSHDNGMLSDGN